MWNTDKLTMFIDVGTNGEMVLGNADWLITCACSAGPAFEGAGVQFGMRATRGAIEKVEIDQADYRAQLPRDRRRAARWDLRLCDDRPSGRDVLRRQ